jgi:LPS-assembly lipoprotein
MMKRHPLLAFAIMALTTFMLTACGFHMRGSTLHDSLPFKSIQVIIPESSQFGVELKRNLRANDNVQVVSDPKTAQVILEILAEKKTKSILSLNIQGRAREYSLIYELRYRVRNNKNKELLPPATIALNRTLIFSESHALARESEEDLLYRDMQTDLVQQLMRRLAAMKLPAQ